MNATLTCATVRMRACLQHRQGSEQRLVAISYSAGVIRSIPATRYCITLQ